MGEHPSLTDEMRKYRDPVIEPTRYQHRWRFLQDPVGRMVAQSAVTGMPLTAEQIRIHILHKLAGGK